MNLNLKKSLQKAELQVVRLQEKFQVEVEAQHEREAQVAVVAVNERVNQKNNTDPIYFRNRFLTGCNIAV